MKYLNSFYEGAGGANNPYAHKILQGELLETHGEYGIYSRGFSGACFDIVKDGVCVGMMAGINGARRRVVELIAEAV